MTDINHFEYGVVTPTLSYAISVLGSLLGLVCAKRVRDATTPGQRAWWLILAAWAIGGTAIWTMHFIAMLGFSVTGSQVRYDVPLTVASAVVAVAAVAVGLFLVGLGRVAWWKIALGGLFTGLGVAGMHYTGMAGLRLDGLISYAPGLVTASVVIAVGAATVALWLAVTVRRTIAVVASALVMGVAVNGMHFTGMASMSARLHDLPGRVSGTTGSALLVPIAVAVIFVVIGLIYALLAAPSDEDRAGAAFLDARLADQENGLAGEAATSGATASRATRARNSLGARGDHTDRRTISRP